MFILINIILILFEIVLIYFLVNNILTKDLIGPNNVNILEYLKTKFLVF